MKNRILTFISNNKYWIIFIILFLLLVVTKSVIINSEFVTKYLENAILVMTIYFLSRNFLTDKDSFFLSFMICLFLEMLKLIGIPQEMLNSGNQAFVKVANLVGTTFTLRNIAVFALGAIVSFLFDKLISRKYVKH